MDLSNAVTVTVYAETLSPLASAVDIVTVQNYITLSLAGAHNSPIWWGNIIITGISSFFAILLAGGLIARRNYLFTDGQRQATERFMAEEQKQNRKFAKEERWHKIADTFCVNMENSIIHYFDVRDVAQRKVLEINFAAYLNSFMLFAQDDNFLSQYNQEKINAECANLIGFDDNKNMSDDGRFLEMQNSVAEIRYLLTK